MKGQSVRYPTIILREIDQTTGGGIVYKRVLMNAKLQIGTRGQKTELTGRIALRRGSAH